MYEDLRRRVVDPKRAQSIDASHPLLGAIVAVEVKSIDSSDINRPVVYTDVFIGVPPTLDPTLAGVLWENFSWGGASARQLKHLEIGEVLLARVTGTWMEKHRTIRVTLDPNLTDAEREDLLNLWEADGNDDGE